MLCVGLYVWAKKIANILWQSLVKVQFTQHGIKSIKEMCDEVAFRGGFVQAYQGTNSAHTVHIKTLQNAAGKQ